MLVSEGYYKSGVSNACEELQHTAWVQRIPPEWRQWGRHWRV